MARCCLLYKLILSLHLGDIEVIVKVFRSSLILFYLLYILSDCDKETIFIFSDRINIQSILTVVEISNKFYVCITLSLSLG